MHPIAGTESYCDVVNTSANKTTYPEPRFMSENLYDSVLCGAGSSIAEEGKRAVHADTDKAEAGSLDWSPDTQLLWNWLSS